MRLTDDQTQAIKQLAHQIAGEHVHVRVFGSRLDDNARGGDLDLMLELPGPADNPALMVPFTLERASQLKLDADLAKRVDAFVGRLGRLQDTIGDKLMPVF